MGVGSKCPHQFSSIFDDLELKKILKAYFTTLRTDFVDFYFLKIVFLTSLQTQNEAKRNVRHPDLNLRLRNGVQTTNPQLGICEKNRLYTAPWGCVKWFFYWQTLVFISRHSIGGFLFEKSIARLPNLKNASLTLNQERCVY